MSWHRWVWWQRPSREARRRDAAREIADHLELEAEDRRDAGLSTEEARAAARRAFGNVTLVREDIGAMYGRPRLDALVQDLRYALRGMRRAPGFALLGIGSSAIGIGAASVIFAVLNAAMLRPLPVADPARLMSVSELDRRTGAAGNELSYLDFLDVRRVASFDGVAALSPFIPASIDAHNDPQRHWGAIASANYFDVARPRFAVGRGFDPDRDDDPAQPPVVVLSHRLWRTRFNGDPSVVGRSIAINGRAATIVGVTAAAFRGTESSVAPEFWIPLSMLREVEARMGPISGNRGRHWLDVLARLRHGVDAAAAAAELDVLASTLNTTYLAGRQDRGFHVERAGQLEPQLRSMAAASFAIALAIAALVVVAGCANVANLLLGRASTRRREIAARMALGASRGRLIRQLVTESVLLALLGGIGGWIIAAYVCPMLGLARSPLGWPLDFTVPLDYRVLLFSIGLSTACGIGFGLLPALKATRQELVAALKSDGRTSASGDRAIGRNVLVIAQVAVCAVLLLCSGLALRSLHSARGLDLGVNNRNLLLLAFDPGLNHRADEDSRRLLRDVLDRVQRLPGIESATLTSAVPLTFIIDNSNFVAEERAKDPTAPRVRTDIYTVGPRFFETFGIRIQSGAEFSAEPGSRRETIVNEAFARAAFANDAPIGRRIVGDGKGLAVAGVAATAKSRTVGEAPRPAIYLPILSEYVAGRARRGVTLAVKTGDGAGGYAGRVREAIRGADPSLAIFDVRTMETHIADALLVPRLMWAVSAVAASVGLGLAVVGIYGVISFAVTRRRRELGIRLAIGALPRDVLLMVVKQGLTLAAAGTAIGIVAALGLTRFAASLLYGIAPTDAATFLAVPPLLLSVALAACVIPARAAASLDPVEVLRQE